MGFLCWLTACALCIAVRGESDPHPGPERWGQPGHGREMRGPRQTLLPLRCSGGFSLGKWFYCWLGPKTRSSSKTQLGWEAKRTGGCALRAWWGWGRENETKLRL